MLEVTAKQIGALSPAETQQPEQTASGSDSGAIDSRNSQTEYETLI